MNEPLNPTPQTATPPVSTAPVDTAPSGHIDPAEYEALRSRVAQYESAIEALNPHAARIKRMMEDPSYVKMLDDQEAAMEAVRARNEPQIDPSLKPLVDKVSKLEEVAETYLKAQKDAAEAPQREFQNRWQSWQNDRKNEQFYQRLVNEHPDLFTEENGKGAPMMQFLGQRAIASDFAPLETVWKENEWRFVRDRASAPPTSLRTDAGDVGIPGPSTPTPQQEGSVKEQMRKRVIELEQRRFGIGRAS